MSELKEKGLLEKLSKAFEYLPLSIANGQARRQIKELIQKPGVTEEWIEEKAIELNNEILLANYKESYYNMSRDFIRSLVKEIQGFV